MEFYGIPRGTIRSRALDKLAVLSLSPESSNQIQPTSTINGTINGYTNGHGKLPNENGISGDLLKLANAVSHQDISDIPITHKELEIIFSLTRASAFVTTFKQAHDLLSVLSPYFLEAPFQKFKSNLSLQLSPSPWDYLTKELTSAIVTVSNKFPQLSEKTSVLFKEYISKFNSSSRLTNYFSLLGFLKSLIECSAELQAKSIKRILQLVDSEFLETIEMLISGSLEDELDCTYLLEYQTYGDEFNSLLFSKLIQQLSNKVLLSIVTKKQSQSQGLLPYLLELLAVDYDSDPEVPSKLDELKNLLTNNLDIVELLVKNSSKQIIDLDEGADYINLSSNERIELAFETKSLALQVLGVGLLVDLVEKDQVTEIVQSSLGHESECVNKSLSPIIISLGSLLIYKGDKGISGDLIHTFPLIISNSSLSDEEVLVEQISRSLALGLKPLDQDSIVTTIYSLVNLLASERNGESTAALRDLRLRSARSTFGFHKKGRSSRTNTLRSLVTTPIQSSVSSLNAGSDSEKRVFNNAIKAVVEIAKRYNDTTITVLTVTVLSQKYQKVNRDLDFCLVEGLTNISTVLTEKEFLLLIKLFDHNIDRADEEKDTEFMTAVILAKTKIAAALEGQFDHPLFKVYLNELLSSAITKGDVPTLDHHRSHVEISGVGQKISYVLRPLAALLPKSKPLEFGDAMDSINFFRNFWFNLVVHGYTETSSLTIQYKKELEVIAFNSPPLASELPRLHTETSFELNTVLRRGSSNHNVKDQKHIISGVSNTNSLELRTLSYPKLMFLSATSLLENLRTNIGDCSAILYYFSDQSIGKANIKKFIGSIAISVAQKYAKLTAQGGNEHFTSSKVAAQLNKILVMCCHRNYDLQDAAFQVADLLLGRIPSSLCHRLSLFTLLDILTLLFDGVVDSDRNKYQPQREFNLKHSPVKITLSDSAQWRRATLDRFQNSSHAWCNICLNKSYQDMKSLFQAYISDLGLSERQNGVDLGISFAVEMAGTILPTDSEVANLASVSLRKPDAIAAFLSQYGWRAKNLTDRASIFTNDVVKIKNTKLAELKNDISNGVKVSEHRLIDVLDLIASVLILRQDESDGAGLVHELVTLPFEFLTSDSMKVATNIWLGIIKERQDDLSYLLLSEIVICWQNSIKNQKGFFSKKYDLTEEGFLKMTYTPSNRDQVNYQSKLASDYLQTHLHIIRFFSSHFQGTLFESDHLLKIFTGVVSDGLEGLKTASVHPFSRLIRNQMIKFSLDLLQFHLKNNSKYINTLTDLIFDGVLSWFAKTGRFPFGANNLKIKTDASLLTDIFHQIVSLSIGQKLQKKRDLVCIFLRDEINKTMIWLSPLTPIEFGSPGPVVNSDTVKYAYQLDPGLAFALVDRFSDLEKPLKSLVNSDPSKAIKYKQVVKYLLGAIGSYKHLILANPISPTDSINLFQPPYFEDPFVIQYNMRSLESHDINLTFFYVPQIVQSLRNDSMGYVARLIVETGKVDQLFAHQIIWNILANRYKDEDATIEDPVKPALDSVMNKMIASFSPDDLVFYQTEFKFFNEVTNISGKLKPYIKKTKAEKKVKIDEEMKKIVVAENVYLPSNPDGVVVDINRSSGKPLQSHAKAPFMATFKIRKEENIAGENYTVEKWQGAIFKVGDDCRQDVLALQLISIFKSIWENCGLDLYCFPYRVTATAPGCGVIDVLPNSISRDMLGREAVNGLYEYFVTKFGNENSIEFENARNNFVKSLAAYSIISYLLQFKDRHNGNIMYDDQGHILHIDFGFCFDIAPGGVTFEAVPFKLTKEMVRVMGGSSETESFKMFEDLFIQGFLSARPYFELIIGNVTPMLGSGLPCFKGDKTIKNLRNRFFLNKSEKEVIHSLKGLIKKSYESMYTVGYDKFQKMTNGIPY